jgi:hypothetical protein
LFAAMTNDPRDITSGYEIPSEGYCDQPYVVRLTDGTWLCTMTTGSGHEGDTGQHVISLRSSDRGRTWSDPVDIEPAGPPEASWVMPVLVPGGRVYAVYVYNGDDRREVISDHGPIKRVDTLGQYCFRFSDDGGLSWSQRHEIPVRPTAIDHANPYGGDVRFFWGVGKPIVVPAGAADWVGPAGSVLFGFAKVGRFGDGFMATSEGWFLRSDNLCHETDPERIEWQLLPDGDDGLRAPAGPVADEHNPTWLSDGRLFCTYRTTDGHPCHGYSDDGGRTWQTQYMTYAPGGRRFRHPRAANFVRRLRNGRFLYWFHHHGGRTYDDRNPVWLCGGVEGGDGRLRWSQPEILLYDRDPATRMSYPDFIEEGEQLYITETQKTVARVHEVPSDLLPALWRQAAGEALAPPDGDTPLPAEIKLPILRGGGGISLSLWVARDLPPGTVLLTNRDGGGPGLDLVTTDEGSVDLHLNDGRRRFAWSADPGAARDGAGERAHVVVVVDGAAGVVSFVVDGRLQDGGEGTSARQFGWGRLDPDTRDVSGSGSLVPADSVHEPRVWTRALRTGDAVALYRAGTTQ